MWDKPWLCRASIKWLLHLMLLTLIFKRYGFVFSKEEIGVVIVKRVESLQKKI